jgi:hypothetical protein
MIFIGAKRRNTFFNPGKHNPHQVSNKGTESTQIATAGAD